MANGSHFGVNDVAGGRRAESLPTIATGCTIFGWYKMSGSVQGRKPFRISTSALAEAIVAYPTGTTIEVFADEGDLYRTICSYTPGTTGWIFLVLKLGTAGTMSGGSISTPGGSLSWGFSNVALTDPQERTVYRFELYKDDAQYLGLVPGEMSDSAIIAQSNSTTAPSGAWGFWALNEGDSVTDSSGNSRSLTLYNGSEISTADSSPIAETFTATCAESANDAATESGTASQTQAATCAESANDAAAESGTADNAVSFSATCSESANDAATESASATQIQVASAQEVASAAASDVGVAEQSQSAACAESNSSEATEAAVAQNYYALLSGLNTIYAHAPLFAHNSVGADALDGISAIMAGISDAPAISVVPTRDPAAMGVHILAHFGVGTNGNPSGKIVDFNNQIRTTGVSAAIDCAIFKLCFVDFGESLDLPALLAQLDSAWSALRTDFPGIVFIMGTAPITQYANYQPNAQRELFSQHVRTHPEIYNHIFDVALAETTHPNGTREYDGDGNPILCAEYTSDAQHPNTAAGRYAVASAAITAFADALENTYIAICAESASAAATESATGTQSQAAACAESANAAATEAGTAGQSQLANCTESASVPATESGSATQQQVANCTESASDAAIESGIAFNGTFFAAACHELANDAATEAGVFAQIQTVLGVESASTSAAESATGIQTATGDCAETSFGTAVESGAAEQIQSAHAAESADDAATEAGIAINVWVGVYTAQCAEQANALATEYGDVLQYQFAYCSETASLAAVERITAQNGPLCTDVILSIRARRKLIINTSERQA